MADDEPRLSHVGTDGSAQMVDVSGKDVSVREAIAKGSVRMSPEARRAVRTAQTSKGNVAETARLAGILAAKKTGELIPLCHPLAIDLVEVIVEDVEDGLEIQARVRSTGRTGACHGFLPVTMASLCRAVMSIMGRRAGGLYFQVLEQARLCSGPAPGIPWKDLTAV